MISTLSLHDALPISNSPVASKDGCRAYISEAKSFQVGSGKVRSSLFVAWDEYYPSKSGLGNRYYLHSNEARIHVRSEEHTSELQSRGHLVCRLLLEKNKSC